MKAFIAACLILAVLITGTAVNGALLRDRLTALTDAVLSLPESPTADGDPAQAHARWDALMPLLSLTVSEAKTDPVTRAFGDLTAGWESGDTGVYAAARARLIQLLRQLRHAESFAWDNII